MPAIATSVHPLPHSPLPFSKLSTFSHHPTPAPAPSSSSAPSTDSSLSSASSPTPTTDLTLATTPSSSSSPTVEAQAFLKTNPVPFVAGTLLGIIVLVLWAMLLLHTLRKRSKCVSKFFHGSHSSQCDQAQSLRSCTSSSEINLNSPRGVGPSPKGKTMPEGSSSTPKISSAPLPYISSSKNTPVSTAGHVLYTPSQMLSVPQRMVSAELPRDQDLQDRCSTSYTDKKDTRKGIHSDEILIHKHKRALPRALPLTSAPPALTAKQILTAQKVERVSRLPSRKLLHLFPPPPPPPSTPPPAIPSSASPSVSSSPASSPPPSPILSKSKRPTHSPAPCVYLSTPPSTCSPNNTSPLSKKGRSRSQSASASSSSAKAKTLIPVPVTRSSRASGPSHPSDRHHMSAGGFSSPSSSSSRKGRHQRSRSSILDGSNFSAPDLLQQYPTPPLPPSSPVPHSRPRLAESDPLLFPMSTPMTVQIPRPVTWTFNGGQPRNPSDTAPLTPPVTPPRSRNGSVSGSVRNNDKRRQSIVSNASTAVSHGTGVAGSVSGSSVHTHYDSYDNDYEYVIASHFELPYHRYPTKQSMESDRDHDHDHELHAIISDAIASTQAHARNAAIANATR